jgi:hypothetical protein
VTITVMRVWIRCDACGCTWREKPAANLLRRLIGRPFDRFTRHSDSGHGTKPAAEVAVATTVERGRSPEDAPMLPSTSPVPRGRALTPSLTVESLERWFDGCDRDFETQAHASVPVTEWLEGDPFGAPAEQPTRRDRCCVPVPRPTMQGTFVERLDALYDGLVKLESFVLKCTREEEATAKRLEPLREAVRPDEPCDGQVLPWPPRKRGKTTAA